MSSPQPGTPEYYQQQVQASKQTQQQQAQQQAQQRVAAEAFQAAQSDAQKKALQTGQQQTVTAQDVQAQQQNILDTKYLTGTTSRSVITPSGESATETQKNYSIPVTDQQAQDNALRQNYSNYQKQNNDLQRQSIASQNVDSNPYTPGTTDYYKQQFAQSQAANNPYTADNVRGQYAVYKANSIIEGYNTGNKSAYNLSKSDLDVLKAGGVKNGPQIESLVGRSAGNTQGPTQSVKQYYIPDPTNPFNVQEGTAPKQTTNLPKIMPSATDNPFVEFGKGELDTVKDYTSPISGGSSAFNVATEAQGAIFRESSFARENGVVGFDINFEKFPEILGNFVKNPARSTGQVFSDVVISTLGAEVGGKAIGAGIKGAGKVAGIVKNALPIRTAEAALYVGTKTTAKDLSIEKVAITPTTAAAKTTESELTFVNYDNAKPLRQVANNFDLVESVTAKTQPKTFNFDVNLQTTKEQVNPIMSRTLSRPQTVDEVLQVTTTATPARTKIQPVELTEGLLTEPNTVPQLNLYGSSLARNKPVFNPQGTSPLVSGRDLAAQNKELTATTSKIIPDFSEQTTIRTETTPVQRQSDRIFNEKGQFVGGGDITTIKAPPKPVVPEVDYNLGLSNREQLGAGQVKTGDFLNSIGITPKEVPKNVGIDLTARSQENAFTQRGDFMSIFNDLKAGKVETVKPPTKSDLIDVSGIESQTTKESTGDFMSIFNDVRPGKQSEVGLKDYMNQVDKFNKQTNLPIINKARGQLTPSDIGINLSGPKRAPQTFNPPFESTRINLGSGTMKQTPLKPFKNISIELGEGNVGVPDIGPNGPKGGGKVNIRPAKPEDFGLKEIKGPGETRQLVRDKSIGTFKNVSVGLGTGGVSVVDVSQKASGFIGTIKAFPTSSSSGGGKGSVLTGSENSGILPQSSNSTRIFNPVSGSSRSSESRSSLGGIEDITSSILGTPKISEKNTSFNFTGIGSVSGLGSIPLVGSTPKSTPLTSPFNMTSPTSSERTGSTSLTSTVNIPGIPSIPKSSTIRIPGLSSGRKFSIHDIPEGKPPKGPFDIPISNPTKKKKKKSGRKLKHGERSFKRTDIVANSVSSKIASVINDAIGKVE